VADTGSTDGTPHLLRSLGATVHEIVVRPWRFDLARNAALALLPNDVDICVTLDLDEVLVEGWREALEAAWTPEVTRFRHKLVWNWTEAGSAGLIYWHDRVHVRHAYRWVYPCHETLEYYGDGSERFVDVLGMTIEHRADPNKPRGQYLPLLELSVRENPMSDRAAFYHGRELYYYQQWERAITGLQRYLALPGAVWREERSEAMIFLARCHSHLGQLQQGIAWALRAVAECPARREVWCELAQWHYSAANWEQCYAACVEALKIEEPNRVYFNEDRVWGALPHDLAAVSAFNIGLYREAYAHGSTALELAPEDGRLRDNLRFYAEKLPERRQPEVPPAHRVARPESRTRSRRQRQRPRPDAASSDGAGSDEPPTFRVVILSARASNLVPCVQSVLANEPSLPPDHVIVVDDGARAEAEAQLPRIRWLDGSKPFNYSRNANLGIRAAGTDVILLNDDAQLVTPGGLSLLARQARSRPEVGILSAGIRGIAGNPNQTSRGEGGLRPEGRLLAFVCVYIGAPVYDLVGPLDERFAGYGFEDNDYCMRVLAAGLRLAICDECVVDHSGALPSTFRTRSDWPTLMLSNQQLFREKWGRDPYGEEPAALASSGRPRFLCAMRDQRQAKYAWYTAVDPNNLDEDCYRHVAEIPRARFAPGPPELMVWRE
jgi:GT2 family glycosyltransferase